MSHDDYYDTISVSAGRCCTNPATIGSVSFRTIGGNGSSSHLAYQHTSAASTTDEVDQNPSPPNKGGGIPGRLHGAPSGKGGSSKHLHERRSLRGTLSAKQTVSMGIGALTDSESTKGE